MAVSGAAPGSARSPPRFRATRPAPRIRGARATGAAERSSTDPTRRARPIGGRPPPHLAATSRARPDARPAEHHRPGPPCPHPPTATPNRTARRRAAPHTHGRHAERHTTAGRPADHTPSSAARALMHAMVAEHTAHLHRQDTVSTTTAADGGVRCSAGFGSLASAVPSDTSSAAHPRSPGHRCGRAEQHRPDAPCAAHRRPATTAPRGDEPRPP